MEEIMSKYFLFVEILNVCIHLLGIYVYMLYSYILKIYNYKYDIMKTM